MLDVVFCPRRSDETTLPSGQFPFVSQLGVLRWCVLRLQAAVVRVDLRITYQCDQFRTRLRGHTGSTFRTADAVDVRIRHDETLSPCVEPRAELCRRRGNVRNRTDQTTPVGAGVTLAHGAGARLQRGDVFGGRQQGYVRLWHARPRRRRPAIRLRQPRPVPA